MYICLIIFQEEVWEVGGQLIGLSLGVIILVSTLTVFHCWSVLHSGNVDNDDFSLIMLLFQCQYSECFTLAIVGWTGLTNC